jgi:hypothetical protein
MPAAIAEIFSLVQALTAYGCYLAEILHHPTLWRGFTTVAQFFGTTDNRAIAARVLRGVMRLDALHDMLLRRAQQGRDLVVLPPRASRHRAVPAAIPAPQEAPKPKFARPAEPPLTLSTLPSQEEIDAEVNSRSIGRTIADICLDLGVSPTLCEGPFWQLLFDAMQNYRGNLASMVTELRRRKQRFESLDCAGQNLPWPERTREGAQAVLGFFIGTTSFPPMPAATAGPS